MRIAYEEFLPKAETISMFWPYSDAQSQVGYNRVLVMPSSTIIAAA